MRSIVMFIFNRRTRCMLGVGESMQIRALFLVRKGAFEIF